MRSASGLNGQPGRPVAYLVFDVLHLDGKWLLNVPLEKRRLALRRILRPGDEVVVVPAIAGEGRALHAAVTAQGIAGVLARRRTSPYLPGVHSALWRSIVAGPMPGAGDGRPRGGPGIDAGRRGRGHGAGARPVPPSPVRGGRRRVAASRGAARTKVRIVGGCPYMSTPAR